MKANLITVTSNNEISRQAADYINSLAMANGFTTPFNETEHNQYLSWFENQISECDEFIAKNLKIEVEEIEIEE